MCGRTCAHSVICGLNVCVQAEMVQLDGSVCMCVCVCIYIYIYIYHIHIHVYIGIYIHRHTHIPSGYGLGAKVRCRCYATLFSSLFTCSCRKSSCFYSAMASSRKCRYVLCVYVCMQVLHCYSDSRAETLFSRITSRLLHISKHKNIFPTLYCTVHLHFSNTVQFTSISPTLHSSPPFLQHSTLHLITSTTKFHICVIYIYIYIYILHTSLTVGST
jgi:hypothetical protein